MALVPAKCPDCGGVIEVDKDKKAGVCKYCGNAFIVEEAINNYGTTNIVNNVTNISGENITIKQDELNRLWVIEEDTLVKYNGSKRRVVIPAEVTEVSSEAIGLNKEGVNRIEEVVIPKTVKYLGANAIRAKRVIIEDNPDLIITRENGSISFNDCDEIIIEGSYGKNKKALNNLRVIRYTGTEEEFIEKIGYDDITTPVVFGDEEFFERKRTSYSVAGIYYLGYVKKGDEVIAVKYSSGMGSIAENDRHNGYWDLSSIFGVKITGFRGNTLESLMESLYGAEDYGKELILPEGIKELGWSGYKGDTIYGGAHGLRAHKIILPKSLEVIKTKAIGAWDEIVIPEGSKLREVEDKAFAYYQTDMGKHRGFTYDKVTFPDGVKIGADNYNVVGSVPSKTETATQKKKTPTREYIIITNEDIPDLKLFARVNDAPTNISITKDKTKYIVEANVVSGYIMDDYLFKGTKILQAVKPAPTKNIVKKKLFGIKIEYQD